MTKSNTPSHAVSHVSPCALNVKAWEFSDCVLPDIAIFSDPFPLTLQKQLGVQVGVWGRGWGGDEHFVGSVCACFQLAVHLAKQTQKNEMF